jgi:hypothetical protein
MGHSRLGRTIAGLGRKLGEITGAGPEAAATTYEQVTRERVDALGHRLDAIELKLNGILLAVFGAFLAEVWRTLGH